ncbi:predicted protein [Naegleria gruberi]|uniref:Predicted protein n=1 Tax=Naegleria gruberi TaxID=5762 RepID=D2VIW5_NAEGR|nr:uncharacterized protein NAEGRDRAFT_68823 [Naegleria gruberi]EFC43172.1 predicted protein [Naegleria gruberi]|eukprot:XP_002675916.1 predicted protein [Naegleria gruberi strain NEG-M]
MQQDEENVFKMMIGVMIQSDLSTELFHYIISFLDTNSMFSLMLSNSFNYFNMNENEYFKTLRFIKFMIEPELAFPLTSGKILQIHDLPSSGNEQILNQCINYYMKRVKYLGGREVSFRKCKELIQFKGTMMTHKEQHDDSCDDNRLNGFHRILSNLMSRFKWFSDIERRDLNSAWYEFCKLEYLNWVEISKELQSAASNPKLILQNLNVEKISNLMLKSATYPHGIKELDMLKERLTNLKQFFSSTINNNELAQFMEMYNNRRDLFYLLIRLGLIPFDCLPNYLKDDSEFVSYCIRHYDNTNIRKKYGKPRIPNWKMYYEHDFVSTVTLSDKLESDKSLIRQAFSTGYFELYSSIYLSSYLGKNRINPFTKDEIEFITSIVSIVPEGISLILHHNEHYLGYNELIEIIRKHPHVFEKLDSKYYHYDQYTELCQLAVKSRGENIIGIDIRVEGILEEKLMASPEWITKVLENGTDIFLFDETIYKNPDYFKVAMKLNPGIITLDESYSNNKEMAMHLIDCCKNIRNYYESADLSSITFSYFSNELLNDSEFVEKAIFETSAFTDIQNLPIQFQTNLKIVKSTLCKQPNMYIHLRDEIKSMKEIGEFAIRCNPQNYNHLPQHLKDCRQIFLFALSRGLKQVRGKLNHQPNEITDPFEWKVISTQQGRNDMMIHTIKIEH